MQLQMQVRQYEELVYVSFPAVTLFKSFKLELGIIRASLVETVVHNNICTLYASVQMNILTNFIHTTQLADDAGDQYLNRFQISMILPAVSLML